MSIERNMDYTTYAVGQVWLVEEPQEITMALRNQGSSVLNGTRPYVVLRHYGCHIVCVPLTTNSTKTNFTDHDIVFTKGDVTSRIALTEIQTKDAKFFTKYYYTFSPESMAEIMNAITDFLGWPASKGSTQSQIEESIPKQEEVKEVPATQHTLPQEVKKTIPSDLVSQVNYRLTKHTPRAKLFRTKEEALAWLECWDDEKASAIAEYFNIPVSTAHTWRRIARQTAYVVGDNE